ncbi:MAG: trehalose-phosphatase [Candidatus Omnitrophica bacterium]|nr:trehalose-phosphatase [Candidatus Omnitrophota bacterium]
MSKPSLPPRLWNTVKKRSARARQLILLLDYDGTLAGIARSPQEAVLKPKARSAVRKLAASPDVLVAIVSGRALEDVRKLVRLPNLIYAGNHGLELKGRLLRFLHPKAKTTKPLLNLLGERLKACLAQIPGARVEHKKLTLSIHDRQVPLRKRRQVEALVRQEVLPIQKMGKVKLTRGKCVFEIRPDTDWGKGALIEWLLKRIETSKHRADSLAIYLGDDETDESAFPVINRKKGISILVAGRPQKTKARFRLKSPKEVLTFLIQLTNLSKIQQSKR